MDSEQGPKPPQAYAPLENVFMASHAGGAYPIARRHVPLDPRNISDTHADYQKSIESAAQHLKKGNKDFALSHANHALSGLFTSLGHSLWAAYENARFGQSAPTASELAELVDTEKYTRHMKKIGEMMGRLNAEKVYRDYLYMWPDCLIGPVIEYYHWKFSSEQEDEGKA